MLDDAAVAAEVDGGADWLVYCEGGGAWKSELGLLTLAITGGDSFDHASGNPFIWK